MEADPLSKRELAEGAALASLTHRHRNQIQNMQSLVGLFGRDLPVGRCRDAFIDLRARFEALAHVSDIIIHDDTPEAMEFREFTERIVDVLDPQRLHRISIDAPTLLVPARRGETIRHLLAEMTIALFRQGLSASKPSFGDITVRVDPDGALVVRASAMEAPPEDLAAPSRDLGWAIATSLAERLGATLVRTSARPLHIEARIPAIGDGR